MHCHFSAHNTLLKLKLKNRKKTERILQTCLITEICHKNLHSARSHRGEFKFRRSSKPAPKRRPNLDLAGVGGFRVPLGRAPPPPPPRFSDNRTTARRVFLTVGNCPSANNALPSDVADSIAARGRCGRFSFCECSGSGCEVNGLGYSSCPRRCCQLLPDDGRGLRFSRWLVAMRRSRFSDGDDGGRPGKGSFSLGSRRKSRLGRL